MARVIPIEAAPSGRGKPPPAGSKRNADGRAEGKADAAAAAFFRNYTQMPVRLPAALWSLARWSAVAIAVAVAVLLVWRPELGLLIFWGLAIPVVPAILVLAPGLWRQVCPMATLNQWPREHGRGRALELPDWAKNNAFAVALAFFFIAVGLRQPWLNHDARSLAALVLGMLVLAFLGGWFFKGRSGWCGTFCPLGPIQRTYGQAPLVMVRNGHCETCVGCQKNCYDFNPRAAVFSDLYDDDARYASQRRLFMGLLPGLLLGYFLAAGWPAGSDALRLAWLLGGAAISAGVYGLALAFVPINPFRLSLIFGAVAISIFYFFAGPVVVATVNQLAGRVPDPWVIEASRTVGLVLALSLATMGLLAERRFKRVQASRAAQRADEATAPVEGPGGTSRLGGARSLKDRLAQSDAVDVTDRETGITFQAGSDTTLLEAIERAGLKIGYGCRAGVCGADPVLVCEGQQNLSPVGDDEKATLRRLGLDRRVRLACMCTVRGPVTIDRDARGAAGAAGPATVVGMPPPDRAQGTGVRQVVVVGNGIAGMSVAEGLRRASPSMDITVVTHEPYRFYNRMGIGRLVYDGDGMDALHLVPSDWAEHHRVNVLNGTVAARIDLAERRLGLSGGRWLPYDRLVLATGARAVLPEPTFLDHDNAFVLRNADDAQSIRSHVQNTRARRAVVVGGGVLGVEAADALHKLGLRVTLLHRGDRLMNAQLDERGAAILAAYLESIGVQVVTGVQVVRYDGEGEIGSAWLAHGPRVRADVFVACLGIQPNTHLAVQSGLRVRHGICVDPSMRTSDPYVFAAGDCAEPDLPSARGLWPIGAAQAAVVVDAIFGGQGRFSAGRQVVQLKCDGIDVRSLGDLDAGPTDMVFHSGSGSETWWRLVLRGGTIAGGVLVGPPGSARPFMKLMQNPELVRKGLESLRAGDLAAAAGVRG
jgi:NADPH-dependent 2,4-dienoyl-CoA reductase/sulfur reductase-like enzyme/ferredoxin